MSATAICSACCAQSVASRHSGSGALMMQRETGSARFGVSMFKRFFFCTSTPGVVPIGQGRYHLGAPLMFSYLGRVVTIRPDFVCDLHSVPRLLRWLFPSNIPAMNLCAVMHDFAYRNHRWLRWTREQCDRLYLIAGWEETRALDTAERRKLRIKLFVMYRAVRRFGWLHFPKG